MGNSVHKPTFEEVERWDQDDLLKWLHKKRPKLLQADQLEKFEAAHISGEAFLMQAGDVEFYQKKCGLSIGPSLILAKLAREIEREGTPRKKKKKKRSGDAEMSNAASKKPRRESGASGQLQKLATSARQQRERIRQVIQELDQPSGSISEDADPFPNSFLQLCNPAFDTKLPFPFVGYVVPERFQVNGKDEDNWYYMGREKFAELRDKFEDVRSDCRRAGLIVYGTRGYGKSHLLAALVCYWAAGGRKVIYIPNCRFFINDPIRYMISAMLFAWADDESEQQEIMALKTEEDIYDFIQGQESVIFVIDQINALEKEKAENDNDHIAKKKAEVHYWLNRLTARHKAIYGSSANNYSILNNEPKQSNNAMMRVYGGLTRNEMSHWWKRKKVDLGDYTKYEVEDFTGCIPWFLEMCVVDGKIDLTASFFTSINSQALAFEREIQGAYSSQHELTWHYKYMQSCFFGLPVSTKSIHMPKLVDHRYFYDEDDPTLKQPVGHYTCGICRDAVAAMLLENRWRFGEKDILQSLPKSITNPSVAGFMIEQAVLSSITHDGLNIAPELNKSIDSIFFEGNAPIIDTNKIQPVLYVPTVFNFRGIDGIIVHIARKPRGRNAKPRLSMFPLQITLAPDKHSNSRKKFFDRWETWTEGLQEFDVKAEFVWISPKEATTTEHDKDGQCPAHVERYVPIKHISKDVWNWYDEGKKKKRIAYE